MILEKQSDEALARLCLIQFRANMMPEQVGYWQDLRWKGDKARVAIERIRGIQPPEIQEKLSKWAETYLP